MHHAIQAHPLACDHATHLDPPFKCTDAVKAARREPFRSSCRADRGFGNERFADVHYRELVEDPLATVHRLYANFDFPFSAAAEARMRQHLAENPKDKYGSHAYSLATFGLDPDDLRHLFKAYTDYFGIQSELEAR